MISTLQHHASELVSHISELTDEDLRVILQVIERTYIHVLIEQGLRGKEDLSGVSRIA